MLFEVIIYKFISLYLESLYHINNNNYIIIFAGLNSNIYAMNSLILHRKNRLF